LKNLLLIIVSLGLFFTSCDNTPTHPDKSTASDVSLILAVVDPPDCELTNTAWADFADEVKALFTDEEIEAIEEALGESFNCSLLHCFEDNFNNHGGFVSCISHWTNTLKKAKVINGKQKGVIVKIAAHSQVGK